MVPTTVDNGNPIDLGGLGIGIYKLEETTPPNNYTAAEDVYFEVYKDTDGSLKARMVNSSGNVLDDQSAMNRETGTDGLIYTITVQNKLSTKWVQFKKTDNNTPSSPLSGAVFTFSDDDRTLKSGSDGILATTPEGEETPENTFELAISETPYTLTETTAPNGYNMLSAVVNVTVSSDEVTAYIGETSLSVTGKGTETDPYVVTITNTAGTVLPETGGVGTDVFAAVGGVTALFAGAVLALRRRRKTSEV